MDLELISFKICPFVQRSVITLNYKNVPYRITYIDLANPPDWFHEISPFGKVPLLKVNESDVLFESAVINEFIDEITPPTLQPPEPLQRALNRAWIEFGSDCLMTQLQMLMARDADAFAQKQEELTVKLTRSEGLLGNGTYFNGSDFSLVDAAYAPLFMRMELLMGSNVLDSTIRGAKTTQWSDTLLGLPAVKDSVVADFPELFFTRLQKMESFAARKLAD